MLETTLLEYGFTEKQAKIYLICLEFGNAPASSIARKLGENRITVYSALKDMCKKGIAFEMIKNDIRYYTVIAPNELLRYEKKKIDKLNEILPHLMSICMSGENTRSKIFHYEGLEGIKNIYEDHLNGGSCKYSFIGYSNIPISLQDYLNNYHTPQRIEKKIFTKEIVPPSIYNKEQAIQDKTLFREYKVVNNSVFNIYGDISLYNGNKVSICSYSSEKDLFGIIIENKYLYDSLLSVFNLIRNYQK